jgi:hypothetical protein
LKVVILIASTYVRTRFDQKLNFTDDYSSDRKRRKPFVIWLPPMVVALCLLTNAEADFDFCDSRAIQAILC